MNIGDTVVWSDIESPAVGTILAVLPDGLYKIDWDHPDDNDRHDRRFKIGVAHEDYITRIKKVESQCDIAGSKLNVL